jgi:hypothetical protein
MPKTRKGARRTYISWVRDNATRLIRLNSTEWVVFRRGALLGHEVNQRTLADVRQAHTSHLEVGLDATEGDDIVRRRLCCFLWWHNGVELWPNFEGRVDGIEGKLCDRGIVG